MTWRIKPKNFSYPFLKKESFFLEKSVLNYEREIFFFIKPIFHGVNTIGRKKSKRKNKRTLLGPRFRFITNEEIMTVLEQVDPKYDDVRNLYF